MTDLTTGTHVLLHGSEGVVVATHENSLYGHCPKGTVIVRLARGITLACVEECEAANA